MPEPIRDYVPGDLPRIGEIYAASKLDELANERRVPPLIPLTEDPRRFQCFLESSAYVLETESVFA